MSTPSRTPHRLFIPHIDTTAQRGPEDYSASTGWNTPLSAPDRRRPSLTYSALSEHSPTSLPSTPAYRLSTNDIGPLYFGDDNNALRMMTHAKGVSSMERSIRNNGLTSFDLVHAEDPAFHVPVSMSSMGDSFNASFSSASTQSWDALPDAPIQQLSQPIVFRNSSVPNGSFHTSEMLNSALYQDLQPMPVSSLCPTSSFDTIAGAQYFSPQQLVSPMEVHEHSGIYPHPMDSGMTSPADSHALQTRSFDSLSPLSPWTQRDSSSPMNEYSLPAEGMIITMKNEMMHMKEESPMEMLPMLHQSFEQPPVTPRKSRVRGKGSAQRRGRTGSFQYVTNRYNVDLAIDTKGIEFDTAAGRYQKKNISTETKRWKCSVPGCDSRSARKEHLRRHELSHQPEKQFHCALPKCGRAITRSDNLIQHLMTHARPPKPGKRNNHYSRQRIERMVLESMTDKKLAERTITNLGKAIEREQDKWHCPETEIDWSTHDADEETADSRYEL